MVCGEGSLQFVTTLPKNANKEIVLDLLCENGISHIWWHHRFLSVFSAWFYPGLGICDNVGAVWLVVLLLQQVLPMDDAIFGEFQLFSWLWRREQMFLGSTTLRDVCFG